jgi:hypothetical protein
MQKYWNTVLDEKGRPREGASVAVQQSGVNSSIYSNQAGSTSKTNPLTTDSRGYFEFYAAAGEYDLVVSGDDFSTYTITDGALIGLPSDDITFTQSGNGTISTNLSAYLNLTVKGLRRSFGATGDGSANDTTAWTNAISDALTRQKIIDIEEGTYLISSSPTITSPIKIYGWGRQASILKVNSSASRFIPILVEGASYAAINGLILEDFAVDGNGKGLLDAGLVQLNNAVGFVVNRLRVFNGGTPAEASPSGVNGISVSAGAIGGTGAQGVIRDCLTEACTKAGLNWTTEAINGLLEGNISRNNTGNGSTPGIQVLGGFNLTAIGNKSYGNQGSGLFIGTSGGSGTERSPKHGVILANHLYSNGASGLEWANATSVNYGRVIIAENHAYSNGTGSDGAGFLIQNDTHAVVRDNYAYLNRASGFHLGGSGTTQTDVDLSGNVSENNNQGASAKGGGYYVNGTFTRLALNNNKSVDTQGSPTQEYALVFDSGTVITDLYMRDFRGFGSKNKPQVFIDEAASITRINAVIPYEKQTTDGSTSSIATLLLPDNSAWEYRIKMLAKISDASDRSLYEKGGLVYRDGGSATREGSEVVYTEIEGAAAWDLSTLVTGNLVYTQLTGAAATTIDWDGELFVKSL